ncbi:MAG: Tol biopolymer transporter periplasmic protein [Cyanobacteriota bacterium]|nr:Tol biopolymer transporter periplasmic protein [Cyanobacteriota bacterium]
MTTPPASTTERASAQPPSLPLIVAIALLPVLCAGCGHGLWLSRRSAGPTGGLAQQADRHDPALSGDGQWLASLVQQNGTPTLLLQEQPSGRRVPLPRLRGFTPHRSPSLSWNGRYLALLGHQGSRRLALVVDRASGRLHRLPLPSGLELERLSLAPDASRLAIAAVGQGRPQVRLFALSGLLEPDRPPAANAP